MANSFWADWRSYRTWEPWWARRLPAAPTWIKPLEPGAEVEDFEQIVYGLDLEYGIRHFRLNAEVVSNTWEAATLHAGAVDLETVSWYAGRATS